MKNCKLPTMKDVATEAGVSLGTVSKVFNGVPVGEPYKILVEDAAKKLGYQVNAYARGLRANKTYTIAVILPNVIHPFFSNLADLCCQILHEHGYRMLLATTSYDPNQEQQCIDMVQQNKVDGIIAITYNPNLEVNEGIPFVIIDRKFHNKVPCVSSDNFSGGQLAAQKLVENGCKSLLFLGISSRVPGEADKRSLGFENYCIQNNISYNVHRVFDDDGIDNIFSFIDSNIIDGVFQYDGIFCNTDFIATQIIKFLEHRGIHIPDNVQVIGYDGIQQFGSSNYYCSTIQQPLREMAATAIDILLTPDKYTNPALICLPVSYCFGGTTKS